MGTYEITAIVVAVVSLVAGFFKVPRWIAVTLLLVYCSWPWYTLSLKNGWKFATFVTLVAISFGVFFLLYSLAWRFSPRGKAPAAREAAGG